MITWPGNYCDLSVFSVFTANITQTVIKILIMFSRKILIPS